MARRIHSRGHRGGIPIEEAPWWALAIFAAILWLVAFPALVGLLAGWGAWHGEVSRAAVAAAAIAALVVVGLATRPSWKRPKGPTLEDPRPLFVRFSTWLWTALLLPNVLFGVLVLGHEGPPLTYQAAWLLGLLVSAIHGLFGLWDRFFGPRSPQP
jgi:hypothetical protein